MKSFRPQFGFLPTKQGNKAGTAKRCKTCHFSLCFCKTVKA